ncbi:MAG: hypothetical protein ACREDR_23040, partial [Blastocatellia bacterium]
VGALMKALEGVDSRTLQALATAGMQPDQLLALSFLGLAEKAERIGELNISPDLMRELMNRRQTPPGVAPQRQPPPTQAPPPPPPPRKK